MSSGQHAETAASSESPDCDGRRAACRRAHQRLAYPAPEAVGDDDDVLVGSLSRSIGCRSNDAFKIGVSSVDRPCRRLTEKHKFFQDRFFSNSREMKTILEAFRSTSAACRCRWAAG